MKRPIVLRANAVPVYKFLSYLNSDQLSAQSGEKPKILDCGAGGPVPPLSLFHEQGFEIWGIDVSERQLIRAEAFCREYKMNMHLQEGDMRQLPFEDETFDAVYEHYSMCHLSKADTALAVSEMKRVLKTGGACFLGFISADSWPLSAFGQEQLPGEYSGAEGGEEDVLHSVFTDQEAENLVSGWTIESCEKHVQHLRSSAQELTLEEWMSLHDEAEGESSPEEWEAKYPDRIYKYKYSHLYYILKKF